MTDRELIEMAAKAAGCEVLEVFDGGNLHIKGPGIHKIGWNPLTDGGDALRLSVRLSLEIDLCRSCVAVRTGCGHKVLVDAEEVKDGYAAARLAITRAAAEIGRNMTPQPGEPK